MSYAELETLRTKGGMLLRRGAEMAATDAANPELYSLRPSAPDEAPHSPSESLPTLRVQIARAKTDGALYYELARVGRSVSGNPVEIAGSKVLFFIGIQRKSWEGGLNLRWCYGLGSCGVCWT